MAEDMKALVVKNPWAWCITQSAHDPDAKTVENRSWATPWRGELAIIEGRALDYDALSHPLVNVVADEWLSEHDPAVACPWVQTRGAVVAVVNLHAMCLRSRSKAGLCTCPAWAVSGQAHWRFDNVRPLAEPVPVRGMQGLFDLPANVEAAVRGQIGGTS
jgi:hypothetical protein